MRQFALLLVIARWTSDDQVRGIIGTATRQRDNMINMVTFAYFFVAVVAFAFLSFQLVKNILSGMLAWSSLFTGAVGMILCSCYFWMMLFVMPGSRETSFKMCKGIKLITVPTPGRYSISISFLWRKVRFCRWFNYSTFGTSLLSRNRFWRSMQKAILCLTVTITHLASCIQTSKFFIEVCSSGRKQFFADRTASKARWDFFFRWVTFCFPLMAIGYSAFLTLRGNPIGISRRWIKVFKGSRFDFSAITATLIPIWKNLTRVFFSMSLFAHSATTCLAVDLQMIRCVLIGMKKFSSCRKILLAMGTMFLRYTIHDRGHSLSGLWMLQHRRGIIMF